MSQFDVENTPAKRQWRPERKDEVDDTDSDAQAVEPTTVGAVNEKPVRQIRGFGWLVVSIATFIACFLYGLDTTIAADFQGPVVEAFGRIEQLTWLSTSFTLGSVVSLLPLGALYNMFDTHKSGSPLIYFTSIYCCLHPRLLPTIHFG